MKDFDFFILTSFSTKDNFKHLESFIYKAPYNKFGSHVIIEGTLNKDALNELNTEYKSMIFSKLNSINEKLKEENNNGKKKCTKNNIDVNYFSIYTK